MPLSRGESPSTVSHNIREMIQAGHPQRQAVAAALNMARQSRAHGGGAERQPKAPKTAKPPKLHIGPIHSAVAGRTDHLPMRVPNGSYVLPADVVSGHGEGNSMAGFKVIKRMFSGLPYGASGGPYNSGSGPYGAELPHKAGGGEAYAHDPGVEIVAAGGEYVLSPHEVMKAGDGDLDLGHKVLDDYVKRFRAETVKTLSKLPGPKKD